MQTTTEPPDLIAAARRRGGLAAKLALEIESLRRQLDDARDRSGPEYLVDSDVDLASWLAGAAADHPQLEDPTAPMDWPAAARRALADLIAQCRGVDRCEPRTRVEELQLHVELHALCEANGSGPELADAIILGDDDHAWRWRYSPREVR